MTAGRKLDQGTDETHRTDVRTETDKLTEREGKADLNTQRRGDR